MARGSDVVAFDRRARGYAHGVLAAWHRVSIERTMQLALVMQPAAGRLPTSGRRRQ